MNCKPTFIATVATGALMVSLTAQAHDTWFRPLLPASALAPVTSAQSVDLALGTGNRYPVQETGVGAEYLERQGCRAAGPDAVEQWMEPLRNDEHALVLRTPPKAAHCWAQLAPLDIELTAALVAVYLQEVQAPAEVRAAWQQMQARGWPWRERYTKHARVDLQPAGGDAAAASVPALARSLAPAVSPSIAPSLAASPVRLPMAMDIVRQPGAAGGWTFQVLREGRPLPYQAMELIGESGSLGIWRRTDKAGRIALPTLPPGRWLLRGTWLRLAEDDASRWDSGFVTLAFEVAAAAQSEVRQGGVSLAGR